VARGDEDATLRGRPGLTVLTWASAVPRAVRGRSWHRSAQVEPLGRFVLGRLRSPPWVGGVRDSAIALDESNRASHRGPGWRARARGRAGAPLDDGEPQDTSADDAVAGVQVLLDAIGHQARRYLDVAIGEVKHRRGPHDRYDEQSRNQR